jgi:hypothetical protein
MRLIDESPNIIQWASEELAIKYFDPITQRTRRYFPDFVLIQKEKNESISKLMVEIKPLNQIRQPRKTSRKSMENYMKELMEWTKNMAKWKAAKAWCESRNMKFAIVTKNDNNRYAMLTEEQIGL